MFSSTWIWGSVCLHRELCECSVLWLCHCFLVWIGAVHLLCSLFLQLVLVTGPWFSLKRQDAAEFMVFTCRARELDLFPCLASCCKMQVSQFLPLFHHPAKTLLLPAWMELLAFLHGADVPQKLQEDCWKPFAYLCTLPFCHLWQLLRPMWAEVCLEQQPLGVWIPVWVPNIFLFLMNVLLSFWAGENLVC